MPSPISININLQKCFQEFLQNAHPQNHPYDGFLFPKKSKFNSYLEMMLRQAPDGWKEKHYGDSNFRVVLPYLESVNVLYNYYLSDKAQRAVTDWIRNLFYSEFHRYCDKHVRYGTRPKYAVELFIEEHNLKEDDRLFQTLTKDYYRYRTTYRKNLEKNTSE